MGILKLNPRSESKARALGLLILTVLACGAEAQESDPRASQVDEQAAYFKRRVDVMLAGMEDQAKQIHEQQAHNMKNLLGELDRRQQLPTDIERCNKDGLSETGIYVEET